MTKVFAITSLKGGVGKTTTASVLAQGLAQKLVAEEGRVTGSVLIVDLDPQGNQADYFGVRDHVWNKQTNTNGKCVSDLLLDRVRDVREVIIKLDRPADGLPRPNLYLIPASRKLEDDLEILFLQDYANTRRAERSGNVYVPIRELLAERLAPLMGVVNYIIIDTPPQLPILKSAVYNFADEIIVPTKPEDMSVVGCIQHTNDLQQYVDNGAKSLLRYILPTMIVRRLTSHQQMIADLARTYGIQRMAAPIPQAVAVSQSSGEGGRTLLEFAPADHPARKAYQHLIDRIDRENK